MARRSATHEIQVDADRGVVIKRFRSSDRGEPVREWNALTLLAEFAPDLAAAPVRADLTADPPVIEISRLSGVPLGDAPVSAAQADALALTLERLWNAVPRARVADLGGPGRNASQLVRRVAGMLAAHHAIDDRALVRRAWQAGAQWFSGGALISVLGSAESGDDGFGHDGGHSLAMNSEMGDDTAASRVYGPLRRADC